MSDAKPSRPIPQRSMVAGVVPLPEGVVPVPENEAPVVPPVEDYVAPEVDQDEDDEVAPTPPQAPVKDAPKVRVPKVGDFNERGAEVASVRRMRNGSICVEYK